MYKPITDISKCPNSEENNEKSIICSQIETGKVSAGQLLCCDSKDSNCNDDVKNCKSYNQYMAKCHDISTLDACRRTDALAHRVCDWKGGLFCLSTRSHSNESDYAHIYEAIEWIINRNKVEESYNVTGCLYQYQMCNNPVESINFGCNDLFGGGCNFCTWKSGKTVAPLLIKGELCEIPAIPANLINSTETTAAPKPTKLDLEKIIPLTIVGILVLALIITLLILRKKFPDKFKKLGIR